MGTEVLKIYIVLGIILVIVLGAGFYYVFNESIPDLPVASNEFPSNPFDSGQVAPDTQSSQKPTGLLEDIEELARANIRITTAGKNKIVVSWENLPPGTDRIVIFRSFKNGGWVRWKTVTISSGEGGSTEIILKAGENASSYSYYAQAFSPNGYTLWASPVTQVEPPAPPVSQSSTSTPTSTGQVAQGSTEPPAPSSQGNQTPTSTTASPSSPTPTSTTTPAPQASSSAGTPSPPPPAASSSGAPVAYYTPSGQIAGYFTPQLEPFYVTHVNQYIEVSWQNLPPPTDLIIVYRSPSQTGPWKELLRQKQPSTSTRDFVRLIDYTLADSYYYRMDALSGSQIVAAYEPAFLPGIGQ